MAKMTIYVQDELKEEMDTYESQQPNWSAIAQEAFTLRCQRLRTRKKGASNMDKVIERLRTSRDAATNEAKTNGYAAGRRWAMEKATYAQLKRLAQEWVRPTSLRYAWAHQVYPAIFIPAFHRPDFEVSDYPDLPDDCADFWDGVSGTSLPSDDYVLAFVDGASDLFEEVKDKVEETHPRRSK